VPDLHDTVAELIRQQSMRVHYLPADPDRWYTARAPCLLTQLEVAVGSSPGSGSGGTSRGTAALVDVNALDLWTEICDNVHGWAHALHVDRAPYRDTRPRLDPSPAGERTVPAVGQLLKAVAARAQSLAVDEVTDRITHKTTGWTVRIRTMLAGQEVDDRIRPIRGATCGQCGAATAPEQRDDGLYHVPAVQVRFMPMEGREPDDLWAYRMCIACGDNGWVDYTTTTGEAA
jgi:hypothetical protein